ncbi:MAG: helix-turn-helix domain-containing protein [Acidobacteria bacterium]|nr:helix-turn-helix domain-containing protein [Acidobacteriota bacterium]
MTTGCPRLLNLIAVAEVCCVSPHTVRKWVREGKLTPLRICRRLLFHPDELVRFLGEAK